MLHLDQEFISYFFSLQAKEEEAKDASKVQIDGMDQPCYIRPPPPRSSVKFYHQWDFSPFQIISLVDLFLDNASQVA